MRITKSTKIILITLIIIIVFIVIKVFVLDIYTVKSVNSQIKQHVLVLKTKSVDINDLVLVNNHYAEQFFVSRIVACGNDTVTIKEGNLYVNSIMQKNAKATYNYRINAFSENAFLLLKDKYKLIDKENLLGVYFLNLEQKIIDSLNNDSVFIIRKESLKKGIVNKEIFPQSYKYRWNEDNFGPLNIKKKGSDISMNKQNYNLYKNTIKAYEEVSIEQKNNKILVNGKNIKTYKFKKEYVFCINDNRSNYNDSRVLGMIPLNEIEGKVIKIF